MALINRPMYEHFGARHLGVKGPGALTQLEEGVMGTLPLDLSADPMYWFIQGIRVFGGNVHQDGVAGEYTKVGLSIESTSANKLVRILSWDHWTNAGNDFKIHRCARTSFSSDPGVSGHGMDTRIPEGQESAAIMLNGNGASNPGVTLLQFSDDVPSIGRSPYMPMILSPGEVIYMSNQTAAAHLTASITWVEVDAYKAEL